jgi:Helix-turn-helix domain
VSGHPWRETHLWRRRPELQPRGERHGRSTKPHRTARGEKNGWARLTAAAVVQIRELRQRGETLVEIAARFDVARGTVRKVCRGETWKHVD